MSLFQENSSYAGNPRLRFGSSKGKRRRSSILKPQKPFEDIQNVSRDDRAHKDRRVSFCPTIEVKEFSQENPTHPTGRGPRKATGSEGGGAVKQVSLPEDTGEENMMSTPVKKKKRRITFNQEKRLSVIPKLEKSFAFYEENDFVIFEDADQHSSAPPTTSSREEITLLEELPEPKFDLEAPPMGGDMGVLANEQGSPLLSGSSSVPPPQPTQQPCADEDSNMQLTLSASSSPPPPAGGRAELMALAPSSANMPTAGAPTLLGTPPCPSHSYYVCMQTPENRSNSPLDVEQEMSFTCLEETVASAGQCSMDLTGVSDSAASPKALISGMVAEPLSTAELHPSAENIVVTEVWPEGAAMSLTCMEGSVSEPSLARPNPTSSSGSVDQTAAGLSARSEHSALHVTGDSRMSLTCVADTPQLPNTTVVEPTPQSQMGTSALPDPQSTQVVERGDSFVFKQPKRLSRSHRKIRSSGRRVVKPSPVVRTPHTTSQQTFQGASLLHSSLTPSLPHTPRGTHNATYTITPLSHTVTPQFKGPATILPGNSASHVSTGMEGPPLSRAPTSPPVAPPSASFLAVMSPLETVAVPQSPALACSVPHVERVPSDSEWLQTSTDSFNLVTANDSLVSDPHFPTAEQHCGNSPRSSATPATLNQSNDLREAPAILSNLPLLQPPPSLTPVPSSSSAPPFPPEPAPEQRRKPDRLKKVIERLRSHGPEAPPITVDTPESAMVEVPPLPPDQSLHISVLNLTLNDTTAMCCPSMLLSPSVYDKFTAKLCGDEGNPQQVAAETPRAGPVTESSSESPQMSGEDQPLPSHSLQHQLQPLTPSEPPTHPVSASDVARDTATSDILFSDFLSELCSRLSDMLSGVHQRLNSPHYLSAHKHIQGVLEKWSRVLSACLGTLSTLKQYGELSGLSHTHCWSSEGVPPELPLPPIGEEDMSGTLARKAEWMMEMIASYNHLHPTAQVARDEAAMLYGWHFEDWSYEQDTQQIQASVNSTYLHFHITVTDLLRDSVGSTRCIAQAVWNAMQTSSH